MINFSLSVNKVSPSSPPSLTFLSGNLCNRPLQRGHRGRRPASPRASSCSFMDALALQSSKWGARGTLDNSVCSMSTSTPFSSRNVSVRFFGSEEVKRGLASHKCMRTAICLRRRSRGSLDRSICSSSSAASISSVPYA